MSDRERNPARERIWNDSAEGMTVSEPGPEHSDEAMKILAEQGVEAYQRHVAQHE